VPTFLRAPSPFEPAAPGQTKHLEQGWSEPHLAVDGLAQAVPLAVHPVVIAGESQAGFGRAAIEICFSLKATCCASRVS